MRIKTGIANLDEKIEGGFPQGSSMLLIGPIGSGKTTFCNQFLYKGLEESGSCIYMVLNDSPREIKENMERFGWKFSEDQILFLDLYSWKTGKYEGKYVIPSPSAINDVNIKIFYAMKELHDKNLQRFALDSLSTFFLYVPSDLVIRFVSSLVAKFKSSNITQVITVEEGAHDPKLIAMLEPIFDVIIEFGISEKEGEHFLKIKKMEGTKHPLEKMKFRIVNNEGIVIT